MHPDAASLPSACALLCTVGVCNCSRDFALVLVGQLGLQVAVFVTPACASRLALQGLGFAPVRRLWSEMLRLHT